MAESLVPRAAELEPLAEPAPDAGAPAAAAPQVKVVSVNCNLMPAGLLAVLTSGDLAERAARLARALLRAHGADADLFYLMELYDPPAREALCAEFATAGWTFLYLDDPRCREDVPVGEVVDPPYKHSSGQGVFFRERPVDWAGHAVAHVDRVHFWELGVRGAGPLEASVPKGFLRVRLQRSGGADALDFFCVHWQSEPLNYFPKARVEGLRQREGSARGTRRAQAQAMVRWIAEREGEGTAGPAPGVGRDRIFIGDFNVGRAECPRYGEEFAEVARTLSAVAGGGEGPGGLGLRSANAGRRVATIGSVDLGLFNKSHSKLIWGCGKLLYEHKDQQLDHALVPERLAPRARLGVFPVIDRGADGAEISLPAVGWNSDDGSVQNPGQYDSLTDHEGIFLTVGV